jgi:hypothetical protein
MWRRTPNGLSAARRFTPPSGFTINAFELATPLAPTDAVIEKYIVVSKSNAPVFE